jgi:protein-tyrosine phosphatase
MVTRIWQRLSVGSLQDAGHLASANPLGITTVLSLCPEEPRTKQESIKYVHVPIADSRPIPLMRFEKVMGEIAMGVRRGSLLVHCFGGMSRAPVICAAWLARCGYASIDVALAEIAELRPVVDPSPTLLTSVRRLLQ